MIKLSVSLSTCAFLKIYGMDKQMLKLKKLIDQYLYKSKEDIAKAFAKPLKKSDGFAWFYREFSLGLFTYETIFIFDEDIVVDIVICKYFLWIEVRNTFYFEGQKPEYRRIDLW